MSEIFISSDKSLLKDDIFKVLSHSEKETESCGMLLASKLKAGDFVALYGDLGAGKTAFVRGIASVIAPGEFSGSPTYTIVNEYEGKDLRLCHFDMYRIKSEEDLESIGFYDYKNCVIAAEWCENIEYALPNEYYKAEISYVSAEARMIVISKISKKREKGKRSAKK